MGAIFEQSFEELALLFCQARTNVMKYAREPVQDPVFRFAKAHEYASEPPTGSRLCQSFSRRVPRWSIHPNRIFSRARMNGTSADSQPEDRVRKTHFQGSDEFRQNSWILEEALKLISYGYQELRSDRGGETLIDLLKTPPDLPLQIVPRRGSQTTRADNIPYETNELSFHAVNLYRLTML
ncbi:MAG TPA: hypothetical protein VK123_07455 [Candidatus Limnocylindrales bacterium]|nr:hypothetical protein [Candidatus Limnocylindrales bacterium]